VKTAAFKASLLVDVVTVNPINVTDIIKIAKKK